MSVNTEQLHEMHWIMEMLHTIDVGLVVLDRQYNVQIWNGFMENHSGLLPADVKDKNLFSLFSELDQAWFMRKAEGVFLLKNKAFTIWEQRAYVFKFQNYRPITGSADFMYQNTTFLPLMGTTGDVTHLCLLIYDVTDNATHKQTLEKANLNLSILSQTDGLTQLFNRSHWQSCLQAEYKRWQRSQNPSCLVMLDIDHFKRINDSYGHMVGDEVIKHISKLITMCARETDISGRYGGEEFAILLADTDLDSGQIFAERLRVEVEQAIVKYNDIDINYTISIGIAQVDSSMKTYEAWIESSDSALYFSKENGRNRISCYSIDCE
jgi:diguanylate cyclase (GGDEF)-like protein